MAHDRLRGEGRAPLEYVGALCLDAAHGVKHVVMVEVRRVIFFVPGKGSRRCEMKLERCQLQDVIV